ncbi:unnamed protein product [Schistosoma margrebowiei]|uniref:Uncharacterized protein n=1 Tax=Schistosoma margrebowiei TaxID=48269 RepID=A0A183N3N6_9TREM|nr:unnamed protein product [Schistosoma margrebowiei]
MSSTDDAVIELDVLGCEEGVLIVSVNICINFSRCSSNSSSLEWSIIKKPPSPKKRSENGNRSRSHKISASRRRCSYKLIHNAKLHDTNIQPIVSDLNFLYDHTVEFMRSGETRIIIAVEIAEQSIHFDRLLE